MFAQLAAISMTLNRVTPIPGYHRERLLSHCLMNGLALPVAPQNHYLWKRDVNTKSKGFDSI